jgi:hypothetical protein
MKEELTKGISTLIGDNLESAITGLPAPVRKNFFKAIGQLSTALLDIPIASLQAKKAEIQAKGEVRVRMINRQGEKFADGISVPDEYIERASEKYSAKIIREQLNLDDISRIATEDLISSKRAVLQEDNKEISDDWLNEFENYAKLKSSDDIKIAFGKILSGEIKRPGSFSIRTIRIISQLDNEVAILFQKFCSITSAIWALDRYPDARATFLDTKNTSNELREYELPYASILILREYGLVAEDNNMSYKICIGKHEGDFYPAFRYLHKNFHLETKDGQEFTGELQFTGISLTAAGKELISIITPTENTTYTNDLNRFLDKKGVKMVEY